MKKPMLWMLTPVVIFLAVIGFVKFQQIQTAIAQGQSFQPPPEAVTTMVAEVEDWPAILASVGTAAPVQGVTLSADLPGVVHRIAFESGQRVAAGMTLVELDTRQERAQLASAEAQRDLAQTDFARAETLLEQKLISQSEFDQAQARFKQANAAVAEIEALIARKTIRAPFAGRSGIRMVNLGQYVQGGDPIVPLQSEAPIYVDFSVPQREAARLRSGAVVHALGDTGVIATGRVSAVNPVVDEATRNVRVRATFGNRNGRLKPGAYTSVQVELGARTPTVAVPSSSIHYAPYGNSVFIVDSLDTEDGRRYLGVRQQFVRLGAARGDLVAVLSGVEAGDEVVTSGVFKLRPAAAVQVNNEVQPSSSLDPKTTDS
jgi:membrane fusion protein (multidrug efflux system)